MARAIVPKPWQMQRRGRRPVAPLHDSAAHVTRQCDERNPGAARPYEQRSGQQTGPRATIAARPNGRHWAEGGPRPQHESHQQQFVPRRER